MNEEYDDFTMAYQDSADQTTVLFIHGFPLNSAMWGPQFDELTDLARLIAPDLRGHGQSDAPSGPYTMATLAEDCAGLLDYLGVNRPVILCGHSMGGYIAFEFYRRFPDMVEALILVSTRPGADSLEGKANRDKMAETAREKGVAPISRAMLPKLLAPGTAETDEELVEFVRLLMETGQPEGIAGALMAMKERPDSTPTLAEIDVPTLIIHGGRDTIVSVAEAEAMAEAIPDARLVVLSESGHMPNLEQMDEFNDALIDFLNELQDAEDEEEF